METKKDFEQQFRIDLELLTKFFKTSNQVIIYGTDHMALMTMFELSLVNVSTICFVDKEPDIRGIFGVPVIPLNNIPFKENLDPIVIITKSFESYESIVSVFRKKGYSKFINLMDHQLVNRQMQRRINNQWIMQIARLYAMQSNEKDLNLQNVFSYFINSISSREEKKAIILITNISPRSYKIIKALKYRGFVVDCIFMQGAAGAQDVKQKIIDVVDNSIETGSYLELIVRLMTSRASFVYMFSHAWQLELLAVLSYLIYKKEFFPTIIFEQYDVGKLYTNFANLILDLEKFCVENADIVCDRSFEIDYLIECHNYVLKGTKVRLFDGLDSDVKVNTPTIIKKGSPLKLCYAGGLVNIKIQDDWGWIDLAKKCEDNHCHLNVYPAPGCWSRPNYKQEYEEFFEMDRNYKYFHLHDPVPYEKLVNVLSQYDYGIHPMRKIEISSKADRFGYYDNFKRIYASSNHFFDYISAGIPIIGHYPERIMKFFKQIGISVDFTIEEYDFDFLKKNLYKYHDKVKMVKENFYVNNLIIDFLKLVLPRDLY